MIVASNHLLIDSSCAVEGYMEDLRGDLTIDSRHIASQCKRFGVGAVRDTGSGISAKSRFQRYEDCVKLLGGIIAITDSTPYNRSEIIISTVSELSEIISLCNALNERWISVRSTNSDFFYAVRSIAKDAGISIFGRGPGALSAASMGSIDIMDGVASLLPIQTSPANALTSAAVADNSWWSNLASILIERGVSVCTGLIALRRSIFLKEAIHAPHLEDLTPIVPHSQYLQKMRQGTGYLAGKRALEIHSGMREPSNKERQILNEGWMRISTWIGDASHNGLTFLPASKAPQLAVLPGYGLLEELALLANIGISPIETIKLATTGAARILGVEPVPGKLTVHSQNSQIKIEGLSDNSNTSEMLTRDSLLSLKPVE